MDGLTQIGIWGVIISGLCIYILKLEKQHKAERKEWLESIQRMFDKQGEITEKTNEIISTGNEKVSRAYRENSSILSGLKTLLEVKNRR